MFAYVWPIALVVLSNVAYQICAKSVPDGIHPLAALTITYLVGAAASALLYFALNREANLIREWDKANWTSAALGLAIVGLEVGYIYAFRAGWPISAAQIVQAAALSVILIFVGRFLYAEALTWHRIVGVLICLAGLILINWPQ